MCDRIPFKFCPSCFIALYAAKHVCDNCGAIQTCAVKRDDAKRDELERRKGDGDL